MPVSGRIRRRLALAIVLTALIPVLVAVWLAETAVRQAVGRFYVPEIRLNLDRSLGLYQELARTVKNLMRQEAAAIAERESLRAAVRAGDRAGIEAELARAFAEHPSLVTLSVRDVDGKEVAFVKRPQALDPTRENRLEVERPLGLGSVEDDVPVLVAVFAAERKRFDELAEMSQFVDTYAKVESRRESDEQSYVLAFALLLGITIVGAVGVGVLLAREVAGRIGALAQATKLVAEGDLTIRVPERGTDEISDLARAFNRMLGEVAESRARIEYLQRIGAWQEMARRLAHEIKNPLTPIQLAVQEAHRRYQGQDPKFQKLMDTTLEIVEDEVGTLRRLVSEFSDFARLPTAHLEREDLCQFVREQEARLGLLGEELAESDPSAEHAAPAAASAAPSGIELSFDLPNTRCEVLMDRQMFGRVLGNLVQNAAQALRDNPDGKGKIVVRLRRDGEFYTLDVEDSGPGIPEFRR